ncbi:MAG: hypothetical protein ACJ8GN_02025 [Longimicrobiaceae bacterium]
MSDEIDEIDRARQELEVMGKVLDALKPLKPAERFRTLAAAAARFGLYDIAHKALQAAEERDQVERENTP